MKKNIVIPIAVLLILLSGLYDLTKWEKINDEIMSPQWVSVYEARSEKKRGVSYISSEIIKTNDFIHKKSFYFYWLFRILFLLSLIFVLIPLVKSLKEASFCWSFLYAISLFSVVMFFLPNLLLFNFQYSLLGKYKQKMPPLEEVIVEDYRPLCEMRKDGRNVAPFCTWKLYPSGIGISIFVYGETFIPLQDIAELKSPAQNFSSRYTVTLKNPELRLRKIALPNGEFIESLKVILNRQKYSNIPQKKI